MLKQKTCTDIFATENLARNPADAARNCCVAHVSCVEKEEVAGWRKKKKKEFERVVQQLSRGEHYEHRICRSWSRGLEILSRATDVFRCTLRDTRSIPGNVCQECREDSTSVVSWQNFTRSYRFLARRMRIILLPERASPCNLYRITLETIMDPVSLHSLENNIASAYDWTKQTVASLSVYIYLFGSSTCWFYFLAFKGATYFFFWIRNSIRNFFS